MSAPNEIRDELIRELPDERAAIRATIMFSGKQPKVIGYLLGIDPSHFSKMYSAPNPERPEAVRHFPPEKINELMDHCGNEIYLRWLLLRRGYASPRSVGSLEAEVERLRGENAELRAESRVIFNVFKTMEAGA